VNTNRLPNLPSSVLFIEIDELRSRTMFDVGVLTYYLPEYKMRSGLIINAQGVCHLAVHADISPMRKFRLLFG